MSNDIKSLADIPEKLLELEEDKILLRNCEGNACSIVTVREFHEFVEKAALRLISLGIQKGDRVALLSENCCQWIISDFAIMSSGAITVPLYPTLPFDQMRFILADSEARGIFLSDAKQLKKIDHFRSSLSNLKWIVIFQKMKSHHDDCWDWERFISDSQKHRSDLLEELKKRKSSIQSDHLASIIYTSGTTGVPKGVMLSHRNFLSNIKATVDLVEFGSKDVGLSFLPLSHVFERLVDYGYLYKGGTIAFSSAERLLKDFPKIKPTIVAAVPRVFEVLQEKILSRIHSSPMKRLFFRWGMEVGQKRGEFLLADKVPPLFLRILFLMIKHTIFRKVHKSLGGRLRFFISGGGPLLPEVGRFFFSMGVMICEGYGLTETAPVISVNTPNDLRFGTVGKILKEVQVKISDDGEIMVKGPNVMKGYYRNEEATREAFHEGWLKTGDIGEIEEGYLIIKERKKDIIVTSSGENISPQRIENLLRKSPLISHAVVFGDAMDYISALIAPNFDLLEKEVERWEMEALDRGELLKTEKVVNLYRKEISSVTHSLASYEKVRRFVLLEKDFSIEEGEMTPTMKVRRKVIAERYRHLIEGMYQKAHGYDSLKI